MFHRSERLLLRPIWPEDWQGIKAGIADLAVLRNLASAPHPYRDKDAQDFTRKPITPRFPRFVVTHALTSEIVGTIGIDPSDSGDPEIGYWIARAHWGRGYATEAGRAAVSVTKALRHKRVVGAHFLDNPASGKVLRKLGFTSTGTTRKQFSLGRGEEADAAEYELDLSMGSDDLKHAA